MPSSALKPGGTVAATVRRHDPDRYIATLYAPADLRPFLWAVYGFAAELAQVPSLVSQSTLGEIRLQWWRQTLDDLCETPDGGGGDKEERAAAGHPVADALRPVVKAHPIVSSWLMAMIEGRSADLYADPMDDMPALEAYFGATLSLPIRVAVHVLAPGADERCAADAAGHGGVALGLARMVSHFSQGLERRPELIPLDILKANGLTIADLRSEQKAQAVILADLHGAALKHLDDAVIASRGLQASALPAVLPLAPLRGDLRLIARRGSGPHIPTRRGGLYRQWIMWRAARGGGLR